jgi:hypothetical protein
MECPQRISIILTPMILLHEILKDASALAMVLELQMG